ncbi:hypothetical protein EDD21DRAFT_443491 [Dissophora ornata]|nr:hypothetical protein EDD21DRAFT_443491 [Dissophora ornata]
MKDSEDHTKYRAYIVEKVLRSLGPTAVWTVLGVVNGNDYSKNLDNIVIVSNYKAFRTMDISIEMDASRILRLYCTSYANDANEMEVEMLSDDPTARRDTHELDHRMQRMLGDVSVALKSYRAAQRRKTRHTIPTSSAMSSSAVAVPTIVQQGRSHPSTSIGPVSYASASRTSFSGLSSSIAPSTAASSLTSGFVSASTYEITSRFAFASSSVSESASAQTAQPANPSQEN